MSPKAKRIKRADELIRRLNNEEAFYCSSWLDLVADASTDEDYEEMVDNYSEIMKLFSYIFLRYINDGIVADIDDNFWKPVYLVSE